MKVFSGQKASAGFALGQALILKNDRTQFGQLSKESSRKKNGEVGFEARLFNQALNIAATDLKKLKESAEQQNKTLSVEVLGAHLMLLEDPEAMEQTLEKIQQGLSAESAYFSVIEEFRQMFLQVEDELIRQRAVDLHDIRQRVIFYIQQPDEKFPDLNLDSPAIVIARDLTPSQILSMDKDKLLGFVTVEGGVTSHTAILARSLEIPALVGVDEEILTLSSGVEVGLNAELGQLFMGANSDDKAQFLKMKKVFEQKALQNEQLKGQISKTTDGVVVVLAANISGPQDLESFAKNDAEAIGLYRTEFVFLDRELAPGEEEQYKIYRDVFFGTKGKHILVRTLDIGGDKKANYLNMKFEENPFLGVRALRLCLRRPEVFKTQLRALLRAGVDAHWGLMFPMVSSLEELNWAKDFVTEVKTELKNEKKTFSENFQLGIMVEVPSAAWMMQSLAPHVDFISIGTNDLLQYTCAADRLNPDLKTVYNPYNIGFLRQIHHVLKICQEKRVYSGICGSLSHHQDLMPFFVGCGVNELSMTSQHILGTRAAVQKLNYKKCQALVEQVLSCSTTLEVKNKIQNFDYNG